MKHRLWAVAMLVVIIVPTIVISEIEELVSSITLLGLRVPSGRYRVEVSWGTLVAQRQVDSSGDPMDIGLKFDSANIRAPIRISVVDSGGLTVFEAELVPTAVTGYRLAKVLMRDAELKGFEVAEVLSMVSVKLRLFGVGEELKGVSLFIENESVVPMVQRERGEVVIVMPPVVIDPGADLDIDLLVENPQIAFRGSLVLIGEKLIAGGSCEGVVSGATMVVEHVFGLAGFRIDVPNPGPVLQREVSRSTTEIMIRRGLPEGLEAKIVLMVKDPGGNPIEGAEIVYGGVNVSGKVITDSRGVAVIDGIRESPIEMTVSKVGYTPVQRRIDVPSTYLTLEIVLERERTMFDEVREAVSKLREFSLFLMTIGVVAIVAGLARIKKVLLAIGVALTAIGIISYVVG